MTLNLTAEVITDFTLTIIGIVFMIITYIKPKTKKLTSLNYIRLAIFSFSVFIFF